MIPAVQRVLVVWKYVRSGAIRCRLSTIIGRLGGPQGSFLEQASPLFNNEPPLLRRLLGCHLLLAAPSSPVISITAAHLFSPGEIPSLESPAQPDDRSTHGPWPMPITCCREALSRLHSLALFSRRDRWLSVLVVLVRAIQHGLVSRLKRLISILKIFPLPNCKDRPILTRWATLPASLVEHLYRPEMRSPPH